MEVCTEHGSTRVLIRNFRKDEENESLGQGEFSRFEFNLIFGGMSSIKTALIMAWDVNSLRPSDAYMRR